MPRLLIFLLLALAAAPAHFAQAQSLPARPVPFTFVTDQANLLAPADAQKLESGLRRYADQNGPQVIVVTVPTLGGREVADYGRALGTAWGVGQRDKNNGLVVLLSGQEHKVTIQAGSGLRSVITPEVTSRVINQQMLPRFKQGDYFGGLRAGLNTLMLAANPSSDPRRQTAATTGNTTGSNDNFPALGGTAAPATDNPTNYETPATTTETSDILPAPEPEIQGPSIGTILIGLLVIGGIGFLLLKMFRRKSASGPAGGNAPDFYGNQPNRNSGNAGSYNGPVNQGGGSGIGGMLATGAAAAAGAYLGNRMASGHDSDSSRGLDNSGAGLGAGAAGTSSGPDYFSNNDNSASSTPDYFSADDNSSSSSDNSSYDDTSSSDTGGGGFDGGDNNSGSW